MSAQQFFNKLIPFVLAGIALVAFAFGIVLLAYLLLFGAMIGLVLFVISWLRNKFFPRKMPVVKTHKKSGRIIDSDDWKEL